MASTLAPQYKLLCKQARWTWQTEQQSAFQQIKEQLKSEALLIHFDPIITLVLSCDASPYGLGAVLSHRLQNDIERPIAFASRTLSPAERRYAQLDKEGLAIIFGLKKFHQYLQGRHFIVYSDHKPLTHLFDPSRAIPVMASACIQRWALTIGMYDYEIQYKPGAQQAHADACSRLPLSDTPSSVPVPGDTILLINHFNSTPVTAAQIGLWTQRDPVLATVTKNLLQGWPSKPLNEAQRPYYNRQQELSVEGNCLLWGNRVIIPSQGRKLVLDELHAEIEQKVKSCIPCQSNRKVPAAAPLHPWEWPRSPWSRIHIVCGPFSGKNVLAHSR